MNHYHIKKIFILLSVVMHCNVTAPQERSQRYSKSGPLYLSIRSSSKALQLIKAQALFRGRPGFAQTLENYKKQKKQEKNNGFEYEILKAYERETENNVPVIKFNFGLSDNRAIDFLTEKGECCECKSGAWPATLKGKKAKKLKAQLKAQHSKINKLNRQLPPNAIKYQHIVLSKQNIPTQWTYFLATLRIKFEID